MACFLGAHEVHNRCPLVGKYAIGSNKNQNSCRQNLSFGCSGESKFKLLDSCDEVTTKSGQINDETFEGKWGF